MSEFFSNPTVPVLLLIIAITGAMILFPPPNNS